jgi:hypothetical protein
VAARAGRGGRRAPRSGGDRRRPPRVRRPGARVARAAWWGCGSRCAPPGGCGRAAS